MQHQGMQIDPIIAERLDVYAGASEHLVGVSAGLRMVAQRAESACTLRLDMAQPGTEDHERLVRNAKNWADVYRVSSRVGDMVSSTMQTAARQQEAVRQFNSSTEGRQRKLQQLRDDAASLRDASLQVDGLLELIDSHLSVIRQDANTVEMREAMMRVQDDLREMHQIMGQYHRDLLAHAGPELAPVDNVVALHPQHGGNQHTVNQARQI